MLTIGRGVWMLASDVTTLVSSIWGLASTSDVLVPISVILTPTSSGCQQVLGEETLLLGAFPIAPISVGSYLGWVVWLSG